MAEVELQATVERLRNWLDRTAGWHDSALISIPKEVVRALLDALSTRQPVGDGYVVVPREPTEEMIRAGAKWRQNSSRATALNVYQAMLAAATPPQDASGESR